MTKDEQHYNSIKTASLASTLSGRVFPTSGPPRRSLLKLAVQLPEQPPQRKNRTTCSQKASIRAPCAAEGAGYPKQHKGREPQVHPVKPSTPIRHETQTDHCGSPKPSQPPDLHSLRLSVPGSQHASHRCGQ